MCNLWEMNSHLCDVLLWSLYTPEELQQIAARVGVKLQGCCRLDERVGIMIAAQGGCRSENDFSKLVQSDLDQKCEDAHHWIVDTLLDTSMSQVLGIVSGPLDEYPTPLPNLLAAVARLGADDLIRMQSMLEWRLLVEGARELSFGKVEIIAV